MPEGGDDPLNVSIQTAETGSFSMDYARFGNGGKSFVILPGLSVQSVLTFANAAAAQFRLFTEDYTVYLFDRRKELPAVYTISDMARDTADAVRALGLKDVYLYGASQGGMIAMTMAIEFPDLVHKLVLASTSACVTEEKAQVIERWIDLAKAGQTEDLYLAFGEDIYPPDVFSNIRPLFVKAAKTVTCGELNRFIILAQDIRGFDITDSLKKIACPALVAGSGDDRVLGGEASLQIAHAIPGAESRMYEGYGHAVYDTAPDFPERILEFLQRE